MKAMEQRRGADNAISSPAGRTTDNVKISLNLPRELLDEVRRMAAERHMTMTDVIRSSIQTEHLLRSRTKNDQAKILLVEPDGDAKEVILSHYR